MTVKEASLNILKQNKKALTTKEIHQINVKKKLTNSPQRSFSSLLSTLIERKDSRVKRTKRPRKYYWAEYEDELNLQEKIEEIIENSESENQNANQAQNYKEIDLHPLLSSYLKNENIYATTISHEESSTKKDKNQKWIHPDMMGVKFLDLKNKSANKLLNEANKKDTFSIISYELKRELKNDYALKECFFQAVSNSSWANYGYLVAFEIAENLKDEIERLNQSFGIGVMELKANPFETKILATAKKKDLDLKTIEKICNINKKFEIFIEQTAKYLGAAENVKEDVKKGFERFSEKYFEVDSEIKKYCEEKNIPYKDEYEEE